jgi:hypothetical protein
MSVTRTPVVNPMQPTCRVHWREKIVSSQIQVETNDAPLAYGEMVGSRFGEMNKKASNYGRVHRGVDGLVHLFDAEHIGYQRQPPFTMH